MRHRRHACWLGALWLGLAPVEAPAARLRIDAVQVGFPGGGQSERLPVSHWYGAGDWAPVLVQITNEDADLFDGTLQVVQTDRDGDEVAASQAVAVRGTRRFTLYVPAGTTQEDDFDLMRTRRPAFSVRVHDPAGNLVRVSAGDVRDAIEAPPAERPTALPPDALVVLDISPVPVNQLDGLSAAERLGRDLIVLRSSPASLPDHHCGLMFVDYIVWDGGDARSFDLAQQEALIEWVRRGGTLLLGVSRNWELLLKSPFGGLLPAKLSGTETTDNLQELQAALLGEQNPFDLSQPLARGGLALCPLRADALADDAVAVVPRRPRGDDRIFVSRRPCGQGRVVLVAAELRDLLPVGREPQRFLRQTLDLPMRAAPRNEQDVAYTLDLFARIVGLVGFQLTSRLYLLFAFCFVVAYIALATGGLWAWLTRIRRTQLAWPAFAAAAVLAGAASLAAVQWIRGFGQKVQELTVVDARAEAPDVVATSFFGLKTPAHSRLDLCVPQDWTNPREAVERRASLLPLRAPTDRMFQERYATSMHYQAVARLGELQDVPFRATSKEFEAHWRGPHPAIVGGMLAHAPDRPGELTDASWLVNRLPEDLRECFLLVRAPGRLDVRVYPVGHMAAGQRLTIEEVILRQLLGRESTARSQAAVTPMPRVIDRRSWSPPTLASMQVTWARSLGVQPGGAAYRWGGDEEEERIRVDTTTAQTALLLLTTREEIDAATLGGGTVDFNGGGRRLDRSGELDGRQALFVGFSDRPGPSRLCARRSGGSGRWRPLRPAAAQVMYRVLLPVGGGESGR